MILLLRYSKKNLRKKISQFCWKTSISQFKFCNSCMDSSRFCLEILRFWEVNGCLCLALPQRAVGDLAYDLAAFCIDSGSVRFPILPRILISTSWQYLSWDRHPTTGVPRYRSLISIDSIAHLETWAFCSGENFMYGLRKGRSLALESNARRANTILLALSIVCGLIMADSRGP